MPRLTALHWKRLVSIFELAVFQEERQSGDHIVHAKPGIPRPVIIPKYSEVGVNIIKANMRTAGLSRHEFFKLLAHC